MIPALLRRVVPRAARRAMRRFLERLGFQHRFLRLRRRGYRHLRGEGLEIGAFEHPAPVPRSCQVKYVDVLTVAEVAARFPEVDLARLVSVDYVVDLDLEGLKSFPAASQDFVIACHVIEHVANPGRLISEALRILRPGGSLVIAAPDRDFTFDRNRVPTPLDRLETYFREGRPPVRPEDYREMVEVDERLRTASPEAIVAALAGFHERREHLSIWTSVGFREFLTSAFRWSGAVMIPAYEVLSDRNQFEYFGVWIKS